MTKKKKAKMEGTCPTFDAHRSPSKTSRPPILMPHCITLHYTGVGRRVLQSSILHGCRSRTRMGMASKCYGRRLVELLQEQQEPFLLVHHSAGSIGVGNGGAKRRRRSTLCGAKAALTRGKAQLLGCFSSCGVRDRFQRLPGDCDVAAEFGVGDRRKLSPVSVLDLHSDEDSTDHSHWDDDYSKPSTSTSSPSSDHHPGGAVSPPRFTPEADEDDSKFHQTKAKRVESLSLAKTEHAIVSAWESIAAGVSRIPRLVELDLSGSSAREWRVGEEEAIVRVGESIEAMIFEEVRWEAVREML